MSDIQCTKCGRSFDIDSWNRSTKEYGDRNRKEGSYGNRQNAFVVCPFCKGKTDIGDFKRLIS